MGLIKNSGTSGKKSAKSKVYLKIKRSFPFFGKKSVMIYSPDSAGAGFSYFLLETIFNSNVSVVPAPVAGLEPVEGAPPAVVPLQYEVRSNKLSDPILVMKDEQEANAVVEKLSKAISPDKWKWVPWAIGGVVLAWVLIPAPAPQGTGPLSINTPMGVPGVARAPVAVPQGIPQGQGTLIPAPPGIVARPINPASGASAAASAAPPKVFPAPAPMPSTTKDPNDPFGLLINPDKK